MPRLYFHLFSSAGFVPDQEGKEVPDLPRAREIAVNGIRSILADDARGGLVDFRGRIEICDGTKEVLAVVRFAEAVKVVLEAPKAATSIPDAGLPVYRNW
jgi:hypothetical protein